MKVPLAISLSSIIEGMLASLQVASRTICSISLKLYSLFFTSRICRADRVREARWEEERSTSVWGAGEGRGGGVRMPHTVRRKSPLCEFL